MEDIYNTLTVSCEKSEMISFASSTMKNIALFPSRSRFAVKLVCCRAFCSVYLNLLLSFYNNLWNS